MMVLCRYQYVVVIIAYLKIMSVCNKSRLLYTLVCFSNFYIVCSKSMLCYDKTK